MENQKKGADELFCASCGAIIKISAEICPTCGIRIKKGDSYAITSFVLGISGLIFTAGMLIIPQLLGLIFGIMGINSSKKGISIAGIILNSIYFYVYN